MTGPRTISGQGNGFAGAAVGRLTGALGPARELPLGDGGAFYRWITPLPDGSALYVTLSCERPDLVYLIAADPGARPEPVVCLTLRTLDDVDSALRRIRGRSETLAHSPPGRAGQGA
jgi:hypothetical protein